MMEKLDKREKFIYGIILSFVGILCMVSIAWPKIGKHVLDGQLVKACLMACLILLGGAELLRFLLKKTSIIISRHILESLILGLLLVSILFIETTVPLVKDIAEGPKSETLKECSVRETHGLKTLGPSYYLSGRNADDQVVTFTISLHDKVELKNHSSVWVEYYTHSRKIISYHKR